MHRRVRSLRLVAGALALTAGCRAPTSPAAPSRASGCDVDVEVSAALDQMTARWCWSGAAPARWIVRDPNGPAVQVRRARDGAVLSAVGGVIALSDLWSNECVVQTVPLGGDWADAGAHVAVVANSSWLWRDDPTAMPTARVRWRLPPGVEGVAPWTMDDDRGVIDATAFQWEGYTAFGALHRQRVEVDGAVLDVAALDGDTESAAWLARPANAVAALFGAFPAGRAQVLLATGGARGEPIAFGLASRGGGASVLLVREPDAPHDALSASWVPAHEFTHLAMPVLYDDDNWLGEGVATYLQEVLRARAGIVDDPVAWGDLAMGFSTELARNDRRRFAAVSRREYHRVYWTGAAVVLRADLALRRRGRDLDGSLRRLRACCAASVTPWSLDALVAWLDADAGDAVWRPLVDEALRREGFPDVDRTLASLGVSTAGGEVTLRDDAPDAALRQAITARLPSSTPRSVRSARKSANPAMNAALAAPP